MFCFKVAEAIHIVHNTIKIHFLPTYPCIWPESERGNKGNLFWSRTRTIYRYHLKSQLLSTSPFMTMVWLHMLLRKATSVFNCVEILECFEDKYSLGQKGFAKVSAFDLSELNSFENKKITRIKSLNRNQKDIVTFTNQLLREK